MEQVRVGVGGVMEALSSQKGYCSCGGANASALPGSR
jgi:hypothetical protein